MELTDALLLIGVGLVAGCVNTLAGGGSLLTLPVLIDFVGLSGPMANGTNRVALFVQNIFAIRGFKSKGVGVFPYTYWVSISACLGAIVGTLIAVDISTELFKRILAVVMIAVMLVTVFKPGFSKETLEDFSRKRTALSIFLFFFVGIYGGFIQAGVGFLVIATLTLSHGLGMVKTNAIKVFVIFCYTLVALFIFVYTDNVQWEHGLVLAIGNATGAWFTSRWSVSIPDKFVRGFLLVAVSALAVKLWFF